MSKLASIAIVFSGVVLTGGILFLTIDSATGRDSSPYPGKIVDKIHRPAYTSIRLVPKEKGGVRAVHTYHPATYHVFQ